MSKNKLIIIFVCAVSFILSACGSSPNLAGIYEGEAKLRKGYEYIGSTAYDAKLEITQSGDMATLKLSDTGFSDDCSFSGRVDKSGVGKITSSPSCSITVPGNRGTLSISNSEFFLSGDTLSLKINDGFSGTSESEKVYILEFSGTKK